jgi:hypothetical protein
VDVIEHGEDQKKESGRSAMADCQYLGGCIFFNDKMANKPALADMMKSKYCKGDFSNCARLMVLEKLGRASVPQDLFPNQTERAKKIMTAA